jgi:3-deoxy-D-manno-octulosonic-acid transferase
MRILYTFGIRIYVSAIRLAALFNRKAALWIAGRRENTSRLGKYFEGNGHPGKVIWFHCSSLGEFEQGRPVIEQIRSSFPQYRILLTFFSPSGFEIRKSYEHADLVAYLPADLPGQVSEFLAMVRPAMAFFVKYDYWFNFLAGLQKREIPVFVISALFRQDHYFFRWYGRWFFHRLDSVTWFFVQDEKSSALLRGEGKTNVSVTGDTRFDRVAEISARKKEFPLIRKFCGDGPVLVAGSTWREDEELLLPFLIHEFGSARLIIAPHDTSPARIGEIRERINKPSLNYSALNPENAGSSGILIIDTIGILAHLYQYATVAYIGGGFGTGIHNIQEPIAFGIPVIFGPNHQKFREAVDLIRLGGAFSVQSVPELNTALTRLFSDTGQHRRCSEICRQYVAENRGATEKIISKISSLGYFPGQRE